jgi:conjugal transfer pilus assembly protein TraB
MEKIRDALEDLKEKFQNEPNFRTKVIVGAAVAAMVFFIMTDSNDGTKSYSRTEAKPTPYFVNSDSAQEINKENLDSKYKALKDQSAEVEKLAEKLTTENERKFNEQENEISELRSTLKELQRQLELKNRPLDVNLPVSSAAQNYNQQSTNTSATQTSTNTSNEPRARVRPSVASNAPIIQVAGITGTGLLKLSQSQETILNPDGTTLTNDKTKSEEELTAQNSEEQSKSEEQKFWLPAGSTIIATLITGVNAPTHPSAQNQPEPVTAVITEDVILPGGFYADLKGCHIIGAAKGSLKDDRAKIRSELISCVREDGMAIEENLAAYASGSDGLEGVKGKRVSLAAPIVTTSILAGVAGGFSNALAPTRIPSLQTSNNQTALFQRPDPGQVAGISALEGTSRSFSRAEEYFMNLADQMHPYIEVTAGRKVEFLTTSGVMLKIKQS